MNKIGNLLKKTGFYKTLEILSGNPIILSKFYKRLFKNKSYYNAFSRIKDELISKDLIEIFYSVKNSYYKVRSIKLTQKGVRVKYTLKTLMKLVG